jgi:hypothetical protein
MDTIIATLRAHARELIAIRISSQWNGFTAVHTARMEAVDEALVELADQLRDLAAAPAAAPVSGKS